jgi:hypothetical protein
MPQQQLQPGHIRRRAPDAGSGLTGSHTIRLLDSSKGFDDHNIPGLAVRFGVWPAIEWNAGKTIKGSKQNSFDQLAIRDKIPGHSRKGIEMSKENRTPGHVGKCRQQLGFGRGGNCVKVRHEKASVAWSITAVLKKYWP